jgi:hypothetical protein
VSHAVYLHVGTAKSGTTYLQRILSRNRELLKKSGVLYPGDRSSHFMASMDLRNAGFKGYVYPEAEGAWNRVVKEVQEFPGDAVISHETLARTPPKLVRKAVESFPGRDVRVVFTCRDLGRQIPAAWQERVKNRNPQTYAAYLAKVYDGWNDGQTVASSTFWRGQNLIQLTRRWSRVVGAENLRLVTVPAPGADPNELWSRFVGATGLPLLDYEIDVTPSNASMGTAGTELLRRLNPLFPEELTWPQYEVRVKNRFVLRDLTQHDTGGRLTVPEERRTETDKLAAQMIDYLRDSGCTVIGDLEDLRPAYRPDGMLPDEVSTEQLLDLSLHVIAGMAARRRPGHGELSGTQAARLLARKAWRKLLPRR